jgi:hypothetical protein
MKSEGEFLRLLEQRAREEKAIVASGILPSWAAQLGEWLGVNPWRMLIPLSIASYLVIRAVLGEVVVELVLALFGGFRL